MKIKSLILSIILGSTAISQMPSYIPTNGLQGYWGFNGNANDQSGNGNNGVNSGASLSTDRFGNLNSSYSFNGTNNKITLTNNTLSLPNSFSISAWVKINNLSPSNYDAPIISQWGGTTTGTRKFSAGYRRVNSQTGMSLYLCNSSNAQFDYYPINWNPQSATWYHYVTVFKPGVSVEIYINGVLNYSNTVNIPTTLTNPTNPQLEIGHMIAGLGNYWFNGIIDDVSIWNRDITQQEITNIYNSCSTTATIVAQNNTTFCSGGSVTLNATTGTGLTYEWFKNSFLIANENSSSYSASQSGSYTVKITDGNCNAISTPIVVTVNPNPVVNILASGQTTFCPGGNVTLTANGGGAYLWSNNSTSSSINVTTGGNYSVTVTTNGCSSIASQAIVVNSNPTVNLTPLNPFINNNSTPITLIGTPAGGTYAGSGVSGTSFNPHLAGLGSKTITYNYTNSNNCSSSASRSTIVYDTTGVVCTTYDTTFITVTDTLIINAHFAGLNNTIGTTVIKIYPNPTSDVVYINTGDFTHLSGSTIKITNALGQSVFTSLINQQLFTINTTQFGARGVYTVQIIDSNQTVKETRKIVLQ